MMHQIIKVEKTNKKTINSIIENFIGSLDHLASASRMENFLSDDRTHLFAALERDQVIGYALV